MSNTFSSTGSAFVSPTGGYASASDVASLCRNLLGGQTSFGLSSSPTLTEVNTWLSSGCGIIETRLRGTISTGTTAYDMAKDLNALFAAGKAEMSRSNVTLQPGERTRGQVFMQMFWDELKAMSSMDLSALGWSSLVTSTGGKVYAGGISQADKASVASDTDRVDSRFKRGQFRSIETLNPSGESYDSD